MKRLIGFRPTSKASSYRQYSVTLAGLEWYLSILVTACLVFQQN